MKNFSLYIWTTALLGLFAGGSIIVLFILIPFWRTLEPNVLMEWFQNFGTRVGITLLPMEMIPFLLSIFAYFIARKSNDAGKNLWLLVNVSNVLILATLFLYFIPVNLSFIHKTIAPENVAAELNRWEMVHIVRTILTVLNVVLATLAFSKLLKKHLA